LQASAAGALWNLAANEQVWVCVCFGGGGRGGIRNREGIPSRGECVGGGEDLWSYRFLEIWTARAWILDNT
jgi:hypothetical protein